VIFYLIIISFQTTFYVHCLASGLFRQEFYRIMTCIRRRRVGVMTHMLGNEATQTQGFRLKEGRLQQECSLETIH
jgi:hypothetical protein